MKTKLYYYLLGAVCFFAACKKDGTKPTPKTTVTTKPITDSISFTINGKNYYVNTPSDGGFGTIDANSVNTYSNQQWNYTSSKDSIMYFKNILLSTTTAGEPDLPIVKLSFFRKYNRSSFPNGNFFNLDTADQLKMYTAGSYVFATDYMYSDFTSGVGIAVSGVGTSYTQKILGEPTTIIQSMQKNSSFVISSFTPVKGNEYLLIAKFNATLFDSNEQPINLTNGYIRLLIDVYSPEN
ncbi:MAG: hypothetical protein ACTHNW_00830 [Mucilaginibacter sp.]